MISVAYFVVKKIAEIQRKIYPENFSSEYAYIISYLCDNEDKNIFQRDIEREFHIGRSTVSNALKVLEKEGLVERKSVIIDARLKMVRATRGAKMINDACKKEIENFVSDFFSDVDEKDYEILLSVISRLYD